MAEVTATSQRSLCKLLAKLQLIPKDDANRNYPSQDTKPIAYFAGRGLFVEDEAIQKISDYLGVAVHEITKKDIPNLLPLLEAPLLKKIETNVWRKLSAFPVGLKGGELLICMANPLDADAISTISFETGCHICTCIGKESEINTVFSALESADGSESLESIFQDVEGISSEDDLDSHVEKHDHSTPPVIRLVNKIYFDAIEAGSSDIHVSPEKDHVDVKIRVDGVMRDLFKVPKGLRPAVASRIKLMAGMDISERRKPQDGRLRLKSAFGIKDLRVSSLPTIHGENIVIRILSADASKISFSSLGLPDDLALHLTEMLGASSRVLLVTGPTGSGKTSTLYAALKHLNDGSKNIITVEDPIEYRISGIHQIQINSKVDLTFAAGLRSILRQDPDVIMVGEIRDAETANIAMQAAQTGHLVLSTVHTNSAASAVTRLLDLGVPSFVLASSLGGVLAQRLVRTLCKECKTLDNSISEEDLKRFKVKATEVMKPVGCALCSDTGYSGRTGVYSLLPMNDAVRHLVREKAEESVIEAAAKLHGFVSLWEGAIDHLRCGRTSKEELIRALGPPDEFEEHLHQAPKSQSANNGSISVRDKPLVLLVEDDENTRWVLKEVLQNSFYDVVEAVDGLDALKKLDLELPSVIVCDLMMPRLDGIDFIKRLRADSSRASIPVLMLTAAASDDNEIRSMQIGADDFVSKGSDTKVLLARVHRLLERHTSR